MHKSPHRDGEKSLKVQITLSEYPVIDPAIRPFDLISCDYMLYKVDGCSPLLLVHLSSTE